MVPNYDSCCSSRLENKGLITKICFGVFGAIYGEKVELRATTDISELNSLLYPLIPTLAEQLTLGDGEHVTNSV